MKTVRVEVWTHKSQPSLETSLGVKMSQNRKVYKESLSCLESGYRREKKRNGTMFK